MRFVERVASFSSPGLPRGGRTGLRARAALRDGHDVRHRAYHASGHEAERAIEAALAEIVRLDHVLSHYDPDSDLAKLVRTGRTGFVSVDPALYDVLSQSLEISRRSGGSFDVTIGPLVRIWQSAQASGHRRRRGDRRGQALRRATRRCSWCRPIACTSNSDCLSIDLGGIGKGYAVERAMQILQGPASSTPSSTPARARSPPSATRRIEPDGWSISAPTAPGSARSSCATRRSRPRVRAASRWRRRARLWRHHRSRARRPVESTVTVIVRVASATEADALSTTLLLSDRGGQARARGIPGRRPCGCPRAATCRQGYAPWRAALPDCNIEPRSSVWRFNWQSPGNAGAQRHVSAEDLVRWDLDRPFATGARHLHPRHPRPGRRDSSRRSRRGIGSVEIEAAKRRGVQADRGSAGVIVKGTIGGSARSAGAAAKVVRVADDRGKWPHIRTNWVTRNKDVLQVTNRSSQPWLENNAALIPIAADRWPTRQPVLLTYTWQPVTVSDLDRGPRLENYLVRSRRPAASALISCSRCTNDSSRTLVPAIRRARASGTRSRGSSTSMPGTCRCRTRRSPTSAS